MSTTKATTSSVESTAALRDEELDAVTGGFTVATEAALKNDGSLSFRKIQIGDPRDPTEVADGLKR